MTTITIDRALLEQVQEFLYRVTHWKGGNHEELTDLHDMKETIKAALEAPSTAPAWHDAPTVPGDWVIVGKGFKSELQTSITQQEIDRGSSWPGRWYGPIPPDGDKP
jgi:hypothetical protein